MFKIRYNISRLALGRFMSASPALAAPTPTLTPIPAFTPTPTSADSAKDNTTRTSGGGGGRKAGIVLLTAACAAGVGAFVPGFLFGACHASAPTPAVPAAATQPPASAKPKGGVLASRAREDNYQQEPIFNKRTVLAVTVACTAVGIATASALLYKRCPPNKILVVYGWINPWQRFKNQLGSLIGITPQPVPTSRKLQGGGTVVLPIFQSYRFLQLQPICMDIELKDMPTASGTVPVDVYCSVTVAIAVNEEVRNAAAVRLLDMDEKEIKRVAGDEIIKGQLRNVIASMTLPELIEKRDKLESEFETHCEKPLSQLGLSLLNVNFHRLSDKGGVITAMGRREATRIKQRADIEVAEEEKKGKIGVALANREQKIQVENTTAEEKKGVNDALAKTAEYEAELLEKQAKQIEKGQVAQVKARAKVEEEKAIAEAKVQDALGKKAEAEERARLEAPAKAKRAQIVQDAEAEKEKRTLEAQGKAAAITAEAKAVADGEYMRLSATARGLKEIVDAAGGNPRDAYLLMSQKDLPALAEISAKAVSNVKMEKVVVIGGKDGARDFVESIASTVLPFVEAAKAVGINLVDRMGFSDPTKPSASAEVEDAAFIQNLVKRPRQQT